VEKWDKLLLAKFGVHGLVKIMGATALGQGGGKKNCGNSGTNSFCQGKEGCVGIMGQTAVGQIGVNGTVKRLGQNKFGKQLWKKGPTPSGQGGSK
jgi:hypothetical protein